MKPYVLFAVLLTSACAAVTAPSPPAPTPPIVVPVVQPAPPAPVLPQLIADLRASSYSKVLGPNASVVAVDVAFAASMTGGYGATYLFDYGDGHRDAFAGYSPTTLHEYAPTGRWLTSVEVRTADGRSTTASFVVVTPPTCDGYPVPGCH